MLQHELVMPHDVFISYSTKDKKAADAVCAVCERNKIRCWIAPRDIIPGTGWGSSIINAIQSSKVMILVFSGNSNTSPQIEREVERAISKGIPVIPVRIEDVQPSDSLEYFISSAHWLDAFTEPFERHLERLATVVHQIIESGKHASTQNESVAGLRVETPSSAQLNPNQGNEATPRTGKLEPRRKALWIAVIAVALIGLLVAVEGFRSNDGNQKRETGPTELQPRNSDFSPQPGVSGPLPAADNGFPVHLDNNWTFVDQTLPECVARGRSLVDGFAQKEVHGESIFAWSNGFTYLIRCTPEKVIFFIVVGPTTLSLEQNELATQRLKGMIDKW